MADIYTSSGIIASTVLAEEIDRNVLSALQAEMRVVPLIRNIDCSNAKTKSYSIPTFGTVTAATIGETADLTSSAFTPTDVSITRGEIGWMTILTDTAAEVSVASGLAATIGAEAAKGFGRKMDSDVTALFSALNGGTKVGTAASTMSVNFFLNAIYTLEASNVNGMLNAVLHPVQVNSLRKAVAASTAVAIERFIAEKARPDGFVGSIYGVDTYQTTLLTAVDGATATQWYGAMLGSGNESPLAIGIWRPVRTEIQRDATRRGNEIVVSAAYGVVEQRDLAGVAIQSK